MANNTRNAAAVKENITTNNEMLTPDNLSMKLLRKTVKAAGLDMLDDNPLTVVIGHPVVIEHDPEAKNIIGFSTALKFKEGYTMHEYLECANKINHMRIIKALVLDEKDPHLVISFDFLITGGITKKAFIGTLAQFTAIALRTYMDNEHIVG
ncbi:MAG: hypothetical protein NT178_17150 [Proteobacteria bacterium]|nr:hypothetical protein [Pseudomonadota bacterium]